MNCGRSSSVEWKLPKLQRRVRFPSPAPPPPGRAPGGFVMPARGERCSGATANQQHIKQHERLRVGRDEEQRGNDATRWADTPATGCTTASCDAPTTGGLEGATRIAHLTGAPASEIEFAQHGPSSGLPRKSSPSTAPPAAFREKIRPARLKTPNLGCFERAGRTFSRFRDDTAPQGELFRAQMKPPLLARSRVRMKPATPLLAHNAAHTFRASKGDGGFNPATRCTEKATNAPVRTPLQRRAPSPEISHVIRLDEVSTKSENVAIPMI